MAVQTEQVPHHIVIIGGGAGGLELATQLGDSLGKSKQAKITLVDQNLTHIWKPLLHEIAAGTLNPSVEEITLPMPLNIIMSLFWVVLSA